MPQLAPQPHVPPPFRPILPQAYPLARAAEVAAKLPAGSMLTETLDGAVVNLADALAKTAVHTLRHVRPDLDVRGIGYNREAVLAMNFSVVVGDTIRIVPLSLSRPAAEHRTLRALHDEALEHFLADLDAPVEA